MRHWLTSHWAQRIQLLFFQLRKISLYVLTLIKMIPLGICASPKRSRVSIFPKNHYVFKKHSNKKDFKSISFTPIYVTQKLTQPGISQVFTFFPSRDKVISSLFLIYCMVTISTLFLWCKYAKSLIKKKSLSIFVFPWIMYLFIYGKSYWCDYFLIPNFDGVNTIGNFKLKRNTSMKHFWDLTVAGKVRGSNELGIGAKMVVQLGLSLVYCWQRYQDGLGIPT